MNALPSLRSPLCALTALLSLGLGSGAFAQSVSTVPVGAMTYTFPATTQTTTTYISIPLTNPSVYTGPVASLTANTITFSGTPFTAGELAQAGSPFFVRIASGPQAGRTMLVTANTANSITVDTTDNSSQTTALDTSGWALAAGNKVEVIVGDTLASLFGDNTGASPLIFVGGGLISSDKIGLYNKTSGKYEAYYYNTTLGRWTSTLNNLVNAGSYVIYPESPIQIARRANPSVTNMVVIGDVPSIAPKIKTVGSNSTIHTGFRLPIDTPLSQLILSNWAQGNTLLAQSDRLGIFNPSSNKFDSYYQRTDGTWRWSLDTATDRSGFVIPAGSILTITKKAAVSESFSYIGVALPYTL